LVFDHWQGPDTSFAACLAGRATGRQPHLRLALVSSPGFAGHKLASTLTLNLKGCQQLQTAG